MTLRSQPDKERLRTTCPALGELWILAGLFCASAAQTQEMVNAESLSAELSGQTEAPAAPPETDLNSRFEAQLAFSDLIELEQFVEAVPVGQRLLELTEQETGPESKSTATILADLAEAERIAGIHDSSETHFLRAIEIIRSADGSYSETVIGPLLGLGSNYQDRGDYLEARVVFEEARTVNRRIFGLLNEGQIDILDLISQTLSSMNLFVEAHEKQLEGLRLMERKYGEDTIEVLPAIYKYARWLGGNGLYQAERGQYVRAISIIRKRLNRESVYMVTPLRETGNSFRRQKLGEGQGLSSLKRALIILEAQENIDALAAAQTLRDIGDWNISFSKVEPFDEEYRRAWNLLADIENGEELRRAWFDDPDYVFFVSPSRRGVSSFQKPDTEPGHVLVTFDVDERGRANNVSVLEAIPPGLKKETVVTSIRRSRFRPRFVDGEAVPATGLARRFVYFYKLDE